MDTLDEPSLPTEPAPPTVRAGRRALVVFAGLPGAGKSTSLSKLRASTAVSVLDSEQVRQRLRGLIPDRVPYRWFRLLVHVAHRARILWRCIVSTRPVVAHDPSTRATTRAMLVAFGWVTRRPLVLVWLHVDSTEALAGQHARGRLIRSRSFVRHARRAQRVHRLLRAGKRPRCWESVRVFTREDLDDGLILEIIE